MSSGDVFAQCDPLVANRYFIAGRERMDGDGDVVIRMDANGVGTRDWRRSSCHPRQASCAGKR